MVPTVSVPSYLANQSLNLCSQTVEGHRQFFLRLDAAQEEACGEHSHESDIIEQPQHLLNRRPDVSGRHRYQRRFAGGRADARISGSKSAQGLRDARLLVGVELISVGMVAICSEFRAPPSHRQI